MMDTRGHPWRQDQKTCRSAKLAFKSWEELQFYVFTKGIAKTNVKYGYECPQCGMWHMTKAKGSGKTKNRIAFNG